MNEGGLAGVAFPTEAEADLLALTKGQRESLFGIARVSARVLLEFRTAAG